MRYDAAKQSWRKLDSRSLIDGKATYSWPVLQGRSLVRAWLTKRDVTSGYRESYSKQILITGIAPPPPPPAPPPTTKKTKKHAHLHKGLHKHKKTRSTSG
jgi:hypothetical protein